MPPMCAGILVLGLPLVVIGVSFDDAFKFADAWKKMESERKRAKRESAVRPTQSGETHHSFTSHLPSQSARIIYALGRCIIACRFNTRAQGLVLPPIEHTDDALAEFEAEKKDFEVEDSIKAVGASRRVLRGSAELCLAWPNYACHHGPRGHVALVVRPYCHTAIRVVIENRESRKNRERMFR